MFALCHLELNHNQHQVLGQKDEQQLPLPIFSFQQHIHHMEQWFHQDFLSNFQQLDQLPVHNYV